MPTHKKGPKSVPCGANLKPADTSVVADDELADQCSDEDLVTEHELVDPFAFHIASEAFQFRQRFGVLHEDYDRYRNLCSRRIHTLRRTLGRRRKPLPTDCRHLQLALLLAERAWAFGTQLQLQNAQRGQISFKIQRKSQSKYRQATCRAHELLVMCEAVGDERTKLEAQAYRKWLLTVWLTERGLYSDGLVCSAAFREQYKLLLDLTAHTDLHSIATYTQQMEEAETLSRICKYHMDRRGIAPPPEGVSTAAAAAVGHQFKWRGVEVHAPAEAPAAVNAIQDCERSLVALRVRPVLEVTTGTVDSAGGDLQTALATIERDYADPLRTLTAHLHWVHEAALHHMLLDDDLPDAHQIGNTVHKALVVPGEVTGGVRLSQAWMSVAGYIRDAVLVATIQRELEMMHACFNILLNMRCLYRDGTDTGGKGNTDRRSRQLTVAALSGAQKHAKATEDALTQMCDYAHSLQQSNEFLISNINTLSGITKDLAALCTAIGLNLNNKLAPSYVLLQHLEDRMSDRETLTTNDGPDMLSPLAQWLAGLQTAASTAVQLLKVQWLAAVAYEEEAMQRAAAAESKRRLAAAAAESSATTPDDPTPVSAAPECPSWLVEPSSKLTADIEFPPSGLTIPCKPFFFDLAISRFDPPHKGQNLHEGVTASVVGKLKSWWQS